MRTQVGHTWTVGSRTHVKKMTRDIIDITPQCVTLHTSSETHMSRSQAYSKVIPWGPQHAVEAQAK